MKIISGKPPLTPEEAAQILKISKYTLYELIKRGEIPSWRIGRKIRIDYDVIMQYSRGQSDDEGTNKNIATNEAIAGDFHFVGSHDPVVELLCEFLKFSSGPIILTTSFQGSMEGLIALYHRDSDIAGIHLWDDLTEEYNLQYIKYLLPGEKVSVINLVQRVQGWITAGGNPYNLESLADITKKEIRFINRQKGSGTRLRLDQYLLKNGIASSQIKGYEEEENTHLGVAVRIANGQANAGIGIEAAADKMGLDFIPLFTERYDLVVRQETAVKPQWSKVLSVINSPAFIRAINQLKGYDSSLTGKVIYQNY